MRISDRSSDVCSSDLNVWPAFDMPQDDIASLWGAITCPTLLLYGANSWASNPERDGRLALFNTAKVIEFENAGHWLHHDQFDRSIGRASCRERVCQYV